MSSIIAFLLGFALGWISKYIDFRKIIEDLQKLREGKRVNG